VTLVHEVPIRPVAVTELEPVIGPGRYGELATAAAALRGRLGQRIIWNVNSTAVGGGVAEMLRVLVAYAEGLGIAVRWAVIGGDPEFFAITKRLHNQIYGQFGAAGLVGPADAGHYEQVLAANADELVKMVRSGDIVLLHDPQTAGLTDALARAGALVIWRCHIGVDFSSDVTRAAWEFLRPYLTSARGFVFSRQQYVPAWVPARLTRIIPPSIDPFSAKNEYLDPDTVRAILATIGVLAGGTPQASGHFNRSDGTTGEVTRAASVTGEARPGPADAVVVQVSRWDKLKDMPGVMHGFAEYVAPGVDSYLMLVGPEVSEVADDPEGSLVFDDCVAQWRRLPSPTRARILLVTLPLDDIDENAATINAIQRHARVIVQKSLAEGFGLTVAEGMWKARPVIGSAVGGISDQIAEGTGILLPDPADLAAFGAHVRWLLDHPDEADQMGQAGHERVREHYLGDRHMLQYAELFGTVLGPEDRP
jgi:trehalose synthase